MPEGRQLAVWDSLIRSVYNSEEDLSPVSKAQPEIRTVSGAPGLGISVCKEEFEHQLAFVNFFSHLGFHSCVASILLTALTFLCHLAEQEGSEDACRLQFLLDLWHLLQHPGVPASNVDVQRSL